MRLLKPHWVTHDGKPIFSIDIHPDGTRFATGGQGDNSGKVVIWNIAPVQNEAYEKDDSIPKMLCQMDNHLACVNAVRWSSSGLLLASAGDDKLVIVWQMSKYGGLSTAFGSGGKVVNVEQWRAQSTLRGHSGDVLDVAWSPHDLWLASCSVDNTVIIWNARKLPEQVSVLRGHSGLVKGVTWDPVGKYLATQSDDKTLRVWRSRDWEQEACITEPFQECGGTTHVLRLDWSPSGDCLVSAHAMNNCGPVAQIVDRDGWKTSMDFVGHRKAITVVIFNPKIYTKKKGEKSKNFCCCAVGSRDRSLSVWVTCLKRPVVVIHDLFHSSVLDISWSANGHHMLCCSFDGSVAFMEFDQEEVGSPLSDSAAHKFLEDTYGKSLLHSGSTQPGSHIIESADVLGMQQQQQKAEQARLAREEAVKRSRQAAALAQKDNMSNSRLSAGGGGTPVKPASNKQIETRTKDGKRRIQPILLIPAVADEHDGSVPFQSSQPTFSSSTEQSRIIVDKSLSPFRSEQTPREKSTSSMPEGKTDEKPLVNGVALLTGASTGQSLSSLGHSLTPDSNKTPSAASHPEKLSEKDGKDRLKLPVKRKGDITTTASHTEIVQPKKKDGRGRPRKDRTLAAQQQAAAAAAAVVARPQPASQKEISRVVYSTSSLSLPVPTIDKSSSKQIAGVVGSETSTAVEIENNIAASTASTVHKVRCIQAGRPAWDVIFTARVLSYAGNSQVVCVACEDASISLLSTASGRRLMPRLMLDSKVSCIRCSGPFVMAITSRGNVFVWNVRSLKAVIKNESLVPVIPDGDTNITSALLTGQGLPVLTLSNGKCYTYQLDLGCWALLTSKDDLLHLTSDHQTCVPSSESLIQGPLTTIQTSNRKSGSQATRLYKTNVQVQQACTLSHLENQLACAQTLQSPSEYHFWLLTYTRYCAQEGLESKLRELCDDLLGPVHHKKATSTNTWQHTVLTYRKRSLLEEVLPILGSNLQLQRLFTEYKDQLDSLR